MSVKKGERKPSCNEAFHVAHQIKNELLNYVLTDLGIDTAKAGHLCKCMNPKGYLPLEGDLRNNLAFI